MFGISLYLPSPRLLLADFPSMRIREIFQYCLLASATAVSFLELPFFLDINSFSLLFVVLHVFSEISNVIRY